MTINDLVLHGVQQGDEHGADYVELRYLQKIEEGYTTRNGEILAAGSKESAGVGIRVLVDGGMSFVETARVTKEEIKRAVKTAIHLASTAKRRTPIVLSEEPVVQTKWKVPVKIPFPEISPETKINRLSEIERALADEVGLERFPYRTILLVTETSKKFIATNEGTQVESDYSLGRLLAVLTAKGAMGTEQRYFSRGAAAGWEFFEDPQFIQLFINEAKATYEVAEKAKPMTFDQPIDMIVGAEVAGIIAHENCGHPSEADRIQGREAMNAGESFWQEIEVGSTRLGSTAMTIIDDPTIPESGGFYLYDDEGVKARPRYLIKEGIANEMLLDRQSAGRLGIQSNAAARASGYDREPVPRMANTYIAPGDYTIDELVEDVKLGIYMISFTEWNIDDRRYQSKYVGSMARLIRNGEITDEFVRRPALEITSIGLFNAVDACGKGFDYTQAICGKCDPYQQAPVWMAGPEGVRLRQIRLGGTQT